jgi:hypothetical protein
MLELLPDAGVINISIDLFLYLSCFIYLIFIIKVSKDTGVLYKTTNNLGIYLEEEMN